MFSDKLNKKILWLKLHFKEVPDENYKQILLNNKATVPVLFAPPVYCCSKYIGPKGLVMTWGEGGRETHAIFLSDFYPCCRDQTLH